MGPGVVASAFLPNAFHNVKTAIEIDAGSNEAKDCVVFPQRIAAGTGAVKVPTGLANNGLVVLGSRPSSSASTRGICVPSVANASARPTLTADDKGYLMYDIGAARLIYWDGTAWNLV